MPVASNDRSAMFCDFKSSSLCFPRLVQYMFPCIEDIDSAESLEKPSGLHTRLKKSGVARSARAYSLGRIMTTGAVEVFVCSSMRLLRRSASEETLAPLLSTLTGKWTVSERSQELWKSHLLTVRLTVV